jgi:REP element-mobilizing transposase RayT
MKRNWYKGPECAYFITNTICDWKNIFVTQPFIQIVIDSWKQFQEERHILFYGFVIMPSHLHYIVQPKDQEYGIVEMQRDFKKYTAKLIIRELQTEAEQGDIPLIEIYRKGVLMREPTPVLLETFEKIGRYANQNFKVWLPEDRPEAVQSQKFLKEKLNYIHHNPVKAKIVDEPAAYPLSSARNYDSGGRFRFQNNKI